jgi:hypothetical protein
LQVGISCSDLVADDLLTNYRRPTSAKKMVLLAELLKNQPSSELKSFVNGEGEDGDETLLEFVARQHVLKVQFQLNPSHVRFTELI